MRCTAFRAFLTPVLFFTLFGCSTLDKGFGIAPMALGVLRSPVTVTTNLGKNGPLTRFKKCILEEMSDEVGKRGEIREEIWEMLRGLEPTQSENLWMTKNCNPSDEDFRGQEITFKGLTKFDYLQDLQYPQNDTLIFVAISGGGARAGVLAQAVFVQLERKFNSIKKDLIRKGIDPKTLKPSSLLDNIHVISTVSGGSLYAYRLARAKTLVENETRFFKGMAEDLKNNPLNPDHYKRLAENISASPSYTLSALACPDPEPFVVRLKQVKELRSTNPQAFARDLAEVLNDYRTQVLDKAKDNLFECIGTGQLHMLHPGLSNLGTYSAIYYFHPLNLFLGPLMTFFTNETYLSVLAGALTFTTTAAGVNESSGRMEHLRQRYDPTLIKLASITPTPRFFFNATALETGLPFVFTQRVIQLPTKNPLFNNTVRLDLLFGDASRGTRDEELFRLRRPLGKMTTLEDLNSTPADMPLAFAAMASAAFPLGFEPLVLTKYGYDPIKQRIFESVDKLHVSDGGLYDNSGLSTLVELFGSIIKVRSLNPNESKKQKLNLILLSINADADEYDAFFANKESKQAGVIAAIPFEVGLPIRTKALGSASLSLIHYANKRRAEELAIANISRILCSDNDGEKKESARDDNADKKNTSNSAQNRCDNEQFNFLYFPVNLSQFSSAERFRIPDPSNLYGRLKKIPTDFRISDDDEVLINQAAELLISSEQEDGWANGLERMNDSRREVCYPLNEMVKPNFKRLDEAFAFYTLCSAATPERIMSPGK